MPNPEEATRRERTPARSKEPHDSPGAQLDNAIENRSDEAMPTGEERWNRIAELAYRRAEQRGFSSGGEVDDWLAAEREFDAGGESSTD